jgi:hypothetical protein
MSTFFSLNEHPVERVARVLLGLGLIGFSFAGPLAPWGYIGVVPLLTGLTGNCPIYSVFGISTCPTRTPSSGR